VPSTTRIALCAALVSACSSDSTAPLQKTSTAPLAIIAGAGQSDTIGANLTQALIVSVAKPTPDTALPIVTFTAVNDSGPAGLSPGVLLSGLDDPTRYSMVTERVDSQYRAVVVVTLGANAGVAKVIVHVVNGTATDTVSYTVKPGAPVRLGVAPRDTAVYVGGTDVVHASVLDRGGNPRSDAVSFGTPSGSVTASGTAGTFAGGTVGRAAIPVSGSGLSDTAFISVVPAGRLAATDGNHIFEFNVDGSSSRTIATIDAASLNWSPDASLITFIEGYHVDVTDTLGNYRVAANIPASVNGQYLGTPQFSGDGSWIYYTMVQWEWVPYIWRVHPNDTTSAVAVTTEGPQYPSPSPDGTQLAVIGGGDNNLDVITLSNNTETNTGAGSAVIPQWAPSGTSIAYTSPAGASGASPIPGTTQVGAGTVNVVDARGGQPRVISAAGALYNPGVTWSPDLQWLVAQNAVTGCLDLLNVSSGLTLPLAFTKGLGFPAWRPHS
jgi:Tol biopolymer transport system component